MVHIHEASVLIHAPRTAIHGILTDVGRFADWNPAITPMSAIGAVAPGSSYATTVRGLIPAEFAYTWIEDHRIGHTLTFAGFREEAEWELDEQPGRPVTVTHRFRQTGPFSRIVPAHESGVVALRLDRLKQRAEGMRLEAGRGTGSSLDR